MIELRHVSQIPNDYFRRWFSDDNFDLIVWYNPDKTIHGFQLCYDKTEGEKALTWRINRGFSHHAIDSGEANPLANRSPVFMTIKSPAEMARVLSNLKAADSGLPSSLRVLVRRKIRQYGKLDHGLAGILRCVLPVTFFGFVALITVAIQRRINRY